MKTNNRFKTKKQQLDTTTTTPLKRNRKNTIRNTPAETAANQWFQPSHLSQFTNGTTYPIKQIAGPIYGYVLPHAGTTYTADIIQHTLRFRSSLTARDFSNIQHVVIFYYPAEHTENIVVKGGKAGLERYYHEYYVPWKSIEICGKLSSCKFYGYNVRDNKTTLPNNQLDPTWKIGIDTLFIISADFSHFLKTQPAIELENRAAMALCYQQWSWPDLETAVDNVATFKHVFSLFSAEQHTNTVNPTLHWIGRTRSPGTNGVGYLSFLITNTAKPQIYNPTIGFKLNNSRGNRFPDGLFVTCYDTGFVARECLGKWFDSARQPQQIFVAVAEKELVIDVLSKAQNTSRLTGGARLEIPVKYYTITYLYKVGNPREKFIRGWHGVLANGAFYLPDVFLENTYENGNWIKSTNLEWPKPASTTGFNMKPTLLSLGHKAQLLNNQINSNSYELYDCYVKHVSL